MHAHKLMKAYYFQFILTNNFPNNWSIVVSFFEMTLLPFSFFVLSCQKQLPTQRVELCAGTLSRPDGTISTLVGISN